MNNSESIKKELIPHLMQNGISSKELFTVFGIGAVGYGMTELLWRGFTHWTMILTGGVCFSLIYLANRRLENAPVLYKALTGALLITSVEFTTGCLVNKLMGWNVWDYSRLPFNLKGQICLPYSSLWFMLCIPLCPFTRHIYKSFRKTRGYVKKAFTA